MVEPATKMQMCSSEDRPPQPRLSTCGTALRVILHLSAKNMRRTGEPEGERHAASQLLLEPICPMTFRCLLFLEERVAGLGTAVGRFRLMFELLVGPCLVLFQ
jgi:hypothetical protein